MDVYQETVSDFAAISAGFADRRRDSPMPVILELLRQVHLSQKSLDDKLTEHMTTETTELAEAIAELMSEAFPESDPTGHRLHHEAVIKQAEEKAKFWQEMRIAAGKWLGIGVLTFLAGAAWTAFLKGPSP
jgi:hypothetical protein